MAAAVILDFWNCEFYWLFRSRAWRRISKPNFAKIGQSVAKLLRFFDFSRLRPSPSWIFQIVNFYLLTVSALLRRYCDFSNFQDGRRRHLGFLKSRNIIGYCGSSSSSRISMPNFVKIGQSVEKIFRFFDFSRWRPSAIMDSFEAYLDYPQWVLVGLYHSAKFGYDRCSSFYNMNISIFGTFCWKMPIQAPKIGVFGQFDPLNGLQYQPKPKKAHPCVNPRRLSH